MCQKKSRPKSVGYKEVREVLKDQYCRRSLEELHEKYVIAPIDKATGNVAFICKRFYAQVVVKELGLDGKMGCSTYESVNDFTVNDVIQKDSQDLKSKFNVNVPNDSKLLPHIYWLPKLHKTPIKFLLLLGKSFLGHSE